MARSILLGICSLIALTCSSDVATSPTAVPSRDLTPAASDSDGDRVDDETDNCLTVANPDQSDLDGDGTGDSCEESSGAASGEGTVLHDRSSDMPGSVARFAFSLSAQSPPTGTLVYRIQGRGAKGQSEYELRGGGEAGPIDYLEVGDGMVYASGLGRMSGKIALVRQGIAPPAEPERSGTKYWRWSLIGRDDPSGDHLELRVYRPGDPHFGTRSDAQPPYHFFGKVTSGGITILSGEVEIDIVNHDGTTPTPAPAGFQTQKEVFQVGDGGSARPDSLVYQVIVSNRSTTSTATSVVISDSVAPNNNIIACREIVASVKPAASNAAPTTCTLGDWGWEWTVGDLPPSSQVELYFRAEVLSSGNDVNRVRVTADQLASPLVDEEPTTVAP